MTTEQLATRRLTTLLFAAPMLFAALVAAGEGAAGEAPGKELIRDPRFERGFSLYAPKTGKKVIVDTLRVREETAEPVWGLAQWSSRHSLAGAKPERLQSGAVRFANEAKAVTVGPPGTDDGDLSLRVSGKVEYGDRARKKGEPWPHLLVEQDLTGHPSLAELKALPFAVSVRLRHVEKFAAPDYTPQLHAAHFQLFITVQNRNRQSPGFGDFYWFGIPLYDDRHRIPRAFMAPDVGLSKFIFTPPGETFTEESVHDGNWVTVRRDLLPLMLEGLKAAWERGFLKDSRELSDYRLGGMNMGWEVPGIFNVALQAKDLSLKAVPK
jgi:hypothetical protein